MICAKEHLTELGFEKIKTIQANMNSKRQELTPLNSSFSIYFLLVVISLFISYTCIINNIDISSYISMVKDTGSVVQVENVQVNGVDIAISRIRDGAIYIGGMGAAGKVVKNCSLPIMAKLGATLSMGAASLIGFKMVQNNLSPNKTQNDLSLKVDKIKTDVSSYYKNKFISNNSNTDSGSDNKSYISELDLEQLQLDYYLQIIILYLLVLVLIFLIMKYIADKYINSIDNLSINNNLKKIFKKIFG